MLLTLFAFLLALGLLIAFHEWGHYWVARRCGVRVLRFSLGFGPVLWRRVDRHGTEWALSAVPLGGYVKMLDEPEPGATPAQAASAFQSQSLARRTAIVAAGPIANLVLAVVLYTVLNLLGTVEPAAVLATPATGTPAAEAGVREGDRVLSVDGRPVASWSQLRWRLMDTATGGGQVALTVQGQGDAAPRALSLVLPSQRLEDDRADLLAPSGLAMAPARARVTAVLAGGAAEAAGLRVGDVVTAAGPLVSPGVRDLVVWLQDQAGVSVTLDVLRDGVAVQVPLTPRPDTTDEGRVVGRIGVTLAPDLPLVQVRLGVVDSVSEAALRTGQTAWLSLKMMGRMVTGQVSARQISGPVTIADYAGQTARAGWVSYIAFLALISVSIAVLNLLPIPMLDGGHLLYYAIEAVRGRPLSEGAQQVGQRVGLGLLGLLMGVAFFNDFSRLFS